MQYSSPETVDMQIIEDPNKMQEVAIQLRSQGKLIALVSTSGALHAGHSAMIEKAREEADVVVLSVIVNPSCVCSLRTWEINGAKNATIKQIPMV